MPHEGGGGEIFWMCSEGGGGGEIILVIQNFRVNSMNGFRLNIILKIFRGTLQPIVCFQQPIVSHLGDNYGYQSGLTLV